LWGRRLLRVNDNLRCRQKPLITIFAAKVCLAELSDFIAIEISDVEELTTACPCYFGHPATTAI
jgi:hypothetical protein